MAQRNTDEAERVTDDRRKRSGPGWSIVALGCLIEPLGCFLLPFVLLVLVVIGIVVAFANAGSDAWLLILLLVGIVVLAFTVVIAIDRIWRRNRNG